MELTLHELYATNMYKLKHCKAKFYLCVFEMHKRGHSGFEMSPGSPTHDFHEVGTQLLPLKGTTYRMLKDLALCLWSGLFRHNSLQNTSIFCNSIPANQKTSYLVEGKLLTNKHIKKHSIVPTTKGAGDINLLKYCAIYIYIYELR